MRSRIYLEQDERGEWLTGEADPYLDVSHADPLDDEALAAFRELGRLVVLKVTDEELYAARRRTA